MKVSLLSLILLAVLVPTQAIGGPCGSGECSLIHGEPQKDEKKSERPYSEGLKAVEQDGMWGFVNLDGELVIPYKYHYVRSFHNGLAMVKLSGKWGYIDWFGNELIPIEFDEVTSFRDSHAFVKKDGRVGLLDVAGNVSYDYERIKEFTFPYIWLDSKPMFDGGDTNKFSAWVNTQLKYPELSRMYEAEGTVSLTFCVDAEGNVSDVKVTKGVSHELNHEAVRVVSESPKWTPATYDGKPVKASFSYSVIFRLKPKSIKR
ncbi:MAG TPA: hypothetical protein DIT75_06875 [Rikenellaceae bacterium]|nr:hypothetical protein [Rikenellaceae bacterium]